MRKTFFLLLWPALLWPAPIHFDAQRGLLKRLVSRIEKKGTDVDLRIPDTLETPLILAAGSNEASPEVISYLIQQGADVNAATADGWTALMSAARRNFSSNISLLLSAGADPSAQTRQGENALTVAVHWGSVEAARILLNAAPSLALSATAQKITPLMSAVQQEHTEIAALLLKKGAPVNAVDHRGWTALMRINISGSTDAAWVLLEGGADPNHQSPEGWTALMEAAYKNRPDMVSLLLQYGARTDLKDQHGRTARSIAQSSSNMQILTLLGQPR